MYKYMENISLPPPPLKYMEAKKGGKRKIWDLERAMLVKKARRGCQWAAKINPRRMAHPFRPNPKNMFD